jgi:pyruvate/2-oxoglutarate dehydrogenase complex dihydrolipoamide dehydrogenase (E3) component
MAKFQMKNVSRANEESETAGLVKLFVDADTDRFLGFAMVGISADEIVHVFTNYMAAGGTATVMKNALPAHPTVAEFLPTIIGKLKPLA